jgi:hypothetical protein
MEFDNLHRTMQEENMLRVIALGLGIISILLGLLFRFVIKYALFKGIAISFFIGGIVLLNIGFNDYTGVFHYFCLIVSIVGWVFGILLVIKIKDKASQFWKGLGIGIMIQAMFIMCLSITQTIIPENYVKLKSIIEINSN